MWVLDERGAPGMRHSPADDWFNKGTTNPREQLTRAIELGNRIIAARRFGFLTALAWAANRHRRLVYVLIEVGGAPDHDHPSSRQNPNCVL
jgi:hypothetical protein